MRASRTVAATPAALCVVASVAVLFCAAAAAGRPVIDPDQVVNADDPLLDEKGNPDVAYDDVNDRYLVVWELFFNPGVDHDLSADLIAARGADGARTSLRTDLVVENTSRHAQRPRVAFGNPGGVQRYLVAWDLNVSATAVQRDIMGQFLDKDGQPLGGPLAIGSAAQDEAFADVGFDATSGHWLVAWRVNLGSHRDIRAQRVQAVGTTGGSLVGGPINVAATAADEFGAAVSRHSLRDSARAVDAWVVAFARQTAGGNRDIFANALDASGAGAGSLRTEIPLIATATDETEPRLDAIPAATGNAFALCACNAGFNDVHLAGIRLNAGTLAVVGAAANPTVLSAAGTVTFPVVAARLAVPPAGTPGYLVPYIDDSASSSIGLFASDTRMVEVQLTPSALSVSAPLPASSIAGLTAVGFFPHATGPAAACGRTIAGADDAIVSWASLVDLFKSDIYFRQWVPTVTAGPVDDGFESGGLAGLDWVTGGALPWTVSSTTPIAGTRTAESGAIGASSRTTLEITLPTDGGILRFKRSASTEDIFDVASFRIDGRIAASWSGLQEPAEEFYRIAPGSHVYAFELETDASVTPTATFFRLDDIDFPPLSPPTIVGIAVTPTAGTAPLTIRFSATIVGAVRTLSWDFGDPASGRLNASSDPAPSHTYAAGGTFTVALRATGPLGGAARRTTTVTVGNAQAPAALRLGSGGGGGGGCAAAGPEGASSAALLPLALLLIGIAARRR